MKKIIAEISIIIMLVAIGLSAVSMAENTQPDNQPRSEEMEKVRERIETLRMWKLTKALDLDTIGSAKIFPIINKYGKKRSELYHAVRTRMKELTNLIKEKQDERLKTGIERLEQTDKALHSINEEERAELKKVLTIEQQARFIIFQHQFEHEVRKIIAESREKGLMRTEKEAPARPMQQEK